MNDGAKKLKMRLPAIFLLAATLLFWGFFDRYKAAGPVLLEAPTLGQATRVRGNCSEQNHRFVLKVDAANPKMASLHFRLPEGAQYSVIRVSGRVRTQGVVAGKYTWRCARLLLTQYDKNNRWMPGKHGLISEDGSSDWTLKQDEFEIMPGAANVDVVIQQAGTAGFAEFDSIRAEPVQLKTTFYIAQWTFAALWLGLGIFYFRRCRLNTRRLRVLITLNAIAILTGTLMPEKMIEAATDGLKQRYAKVVRQEHREKQAVQPSEKPAQTPKAVKLTHDETRRIDRFNQMVGRAHSAGHFALFASLCFLVYLSAMLERRHGSYFFKVAFDILLFASVTESLQYLTLDRTPGILDWRIDVYGLLTGLALFLLVRFFPKVGTRSQASG